MTAPSEAPLTPPGREYFSASPLCDEVQLSLARLMAVDDLGPVGAPAQPVGARMPALEVVRDSKSIFATLLGCLLIAFKICLPLAVVASFSFHYSEVRGASMMPGIQDQDRILVDHLSYVFAEIDRGDVIVLRYPLDPSLDYIKRVVALPGDEVIVQFGGLWVNGDPVEEPYVDFEAWDPSTSMHTTVKEGHYFVMGDNRIRSSDSREFGQVAKSLVRGKVRFRVWPWSRAGRVQ